jgi:hypothetical protein
LLLHIAYQHRCDDGLLNPARRQLDQELQVSDVLFNRRSEVVRLIKITLKIRRLAAFTLPSVNEAYIL